MFRTVLSAVGGDLHDDVAAVGITVGARAIAIVLSFLHGADKSDLRHLCVGLSHASDAKSLLQQCEND